MMKPGMGSYWPLLRKALRKMGRADLIGNGKKHLVPSWQPKGTGKSGDKGQKGKHRPFMTKHTDSLSHNGPKNKKSKSAKRTTRKRRNSSRTPT